MKVKRVAAPIQATTVVTASKETREDGALVSEKYASNPFLDPNVEAHYKVVYEKNQYECRHIFNAHLEWTGDEERRVVRKIDLRVCLWACVMFFALQVDRGNLGQAVSDNMLDQLNLTTNDYNLGNTVNLVSFLLAELPSQLVSKAVGPDRWIPAQIVLWSVVACSQAALTGKTSFLVTRALIGALEGGFIPDIVLWLSYFYTAAELPIRLSFFWTSMGLTSIVTSLLAFALLHLEGTAGLAGWRWLFLVEGIVTLAVGVASFFMMPASAAQTKTWFRPKGWFTDRELGIVVNRVLRDDPSKGDMHNRMAITPRRLWAGLMDYDLLPIYALGLVTLIPPTPPGLYLTLSLRELGFTPFNTTLLTIPSTAIGILTLLGITWLSERVNERALIAMLMDVWTLPCIIALRWWSGANTDPWGTFGLITILLAYPYSHAILVAWCSKNSGSVRTRSISAACYNVCVQLGTVVSANMYRTEDAPLYHHGNEVLLGINALSIAMFILTKIYYISRNQWKDRQWQAMTEEQRSEYVRTSADEGNRRLDFRFAH